MQIQTVPLGHYRAPAIEGPNVVGLPFGKQDIPSGLIKKLWNTLAALGEPVTVQPGATVDMTIPDNTIHAGRAAARLGISSERDLLHW